MIEILNIILSFSVFFLFSLFPITCQYVDKLIIFKNKSIFEVLFVNLLINILILFFLSFTKINLLIYFFVTIFLSLTINIKYFFKKKFINELKNIIFLFFILLNILIYIYVASDPTLSWDGQQNWYYKAQNFFYNYNFFDLNDTNSVKYYPHLGSLLWGFFWKTSFLQYEYFGRLVFVYIFLISIFSISNKINKNRFLEILTISILVLICFDSFLIKGYQEILVFSFFIFISINIYNYLLTEKKFDLLICFLCLNFLPWIKNEGYLYVLIFNLSILLNFNNFSKKFILAAFVLISLILLGLKKILYLKYLGINLTHGSEINLIHNFDLYKKFVYEMIIGLMVAFFKYKLWILIFVSIYILFKKKKIRMAGKKIINFFLINLFLYSLMIFGIYYSFLNHIYGIEWWIDNSLDRILFQISGFFILFIILAINNTKKIT